MPQNNTHALIAVTVAGFLWWLLRRDSQEGEPPKDGPPAGGVSSAIEDIILSQHVCLHIRRDNAIERFPGSDVEITVVISGRAGGAYRATVTVFNTAGNRISAVTDEAILGGGQTVATVRTTIVAPEFDLDRNVYDVEATLELMGPGGSFAPVIDPKTGEPAKILLENALKIVTASETGTDVGGGVAGGHIILYQDEEANSYDEVYR